jgi:hypothetical protein
MNAASASQIANESHQPRLAMFLQPCLNRAAKQSDITYS